MPQKNEIKQALLMELETLYRTMPLKDAFIAGTAESMDWLGRARAALASSGETLVAAQFQVLSNSLLSVSPVSPSYDSGNYTKMQVCLRHASHALRLQTVGPVNIAVGHAEVFRYFDQIRKIIEVTKDDILIVDPYLDADFVADYLPYVAQGVSVRLMTERKLSSLAPAAAKFAAENGTNLEIRKCKGLHDRFVFVDRAACYHSGASFKDGAKTAPTIISQITDAFDVMLHTYETKWSEGKPVAHGN